MDQKASDGSKSKRWIKEQAMDQRAMEGSMDQVEIAGSMDQGASNGSGSNRRRDGLSKQFDGSGSKRWIKEQWKEIWIRLKS
jgi:hypothetical protein